MSTGHMIVCGGVILALVDLFYKSWKDKKIYLETSSFITALGNGITLCTGCLLTWVSLTAGDDATLPVGENRVGVVIGGFTMFIYAANQFFSKLRTPQQSDETLQ